MKGSPSKKEIKMYPKGIGWHCNDTAYMKETSSVGLGVYYKKRIKVLRFCMNRLCYADNYEVHHKYADRFEKASRSKLRWLIRNATSKQQPVDQELGTYCQEYVKKQFFHLERIYNQDIRNGLNPPRRGLSDMRIWCMMQMHKLLNELRKNRKQLIIHSWKKSGLLLALDGSEDDENERSFFK